MYHVLQGDETLTPAQLGEMDAKVRQLNVLLDNMRINPLADRLVQTLLGVVRDNLLTVRKAAVHREDCDMEVLALAMQLEEEMLKAEKTYAGRVAMATAQ